MTEKDMKVTFDEDRRVIALLDAMAEAEGTARSALIRRAVRQLVFSSPTIPTFGKSPEPADAAA